MKSLSSLLLPWANIAPPITEQHTLLPVAEIDALYTAEDARDREFFSLMIPATIGRFKMKMRPIVRIGDRLSRRNIVDAITSIRVASYNGSGIAHEVPFQQNTDSNGFGSGNGMESDYVHPELKQVERIRLHQSGQYRIDRFLEEDYSDDHVLKFDDLTLWNDAFIHRLTLLFALAARAAAAIGIGAAELVEITLNVSGLGNRRLVPFTSTPTAQELFILSQSRASSEATCERRYVLTRDEIERNFPRFAREMVCDVYWNFGLTDDSIAEYISDVQRYFLRK